MYIYIYMRSPKESIITRTETEVERNGSIENMPYVSSSHKLIQLPIVLCYCREGRMTDATKILVKYVLIVPSNSEFSWIYFALNISSYSMKVWTKCTPYKHISILLALLEEEHKLQFFPFTRQNSHRLTNSTNYRFGGALKANQYRFSRLKYTQLQIKHCLVVAGLDK